VEVMSMDGKLWTEAQAIAARHEPGCAAEGEDLAQDLAVAALERGSAVRQPAAWLERVGRNAAIDRWRVEARRAELAPEIQPPAAPLDPETALLGRERRGLVRRALAALPRPQRRAALARFHADLPYDEVAARLGAPAITARTRVHRALASLRARLDALRVMVLVPGVQLSALGVVFVAATSPGLGPARAVSW
jgi:RNA polymerase sigma factor (sigma-70 family)